MVWFMWLMWWTLIQTQGVGKMNKGNRPKDEGKELRNKPINVMFTPSELAELDEWVYQNRFSSRNEAIRALIARGMEK
jgi:hypothetical protein